MKYGLISVLALALACGCSKKPAASANEAEPESRTTAGAASTQGAPPPDFDALLAREATALAATEVKGPAGAFTARVSSKGTPQTALVEGVAVVEIPIGAETPVRCQVFPDDVDPGGTLAGLFDDARKKVEFRRMIPWSVTAIDGAPAAFVRALYLAPGPRGKSMGELKTMVHGFPGHGVLCLHDELGYEKTFTTVATEFGQSLAFPGAKRREPQLIDIQQVSLQGLAVGFARRELVSDAGKRSDVMNGFVMLPVSEAELRFSDYYEVQQFDTSGHLATGVWVEASNGQLDLKVKVDHTKDGDYTYAGEAKGKPVSGAFTTKDKKPLPGSLSMARALAPHARDAKPFSVEQLEYSPELDLAAPTPVRYSREAGDAASSVRITKPKSAATAMLDEHGLFEKSSIPLGASTMEISRVFVRGKP